MDLKVEKNIYIGMELMLLLLMVTDIMVLLLTILVVAHSIDPQRSNERIAASQPSTQVRHIQSEVVLQESRAAEIERKL